MYAALIRGRHDIPTTNYIFDSVEDVKDYQAMNDVATNWLLTNIGVHTEYGHAINAASYTDDTVYTGNDRLYLYVTGLSAALAAVIKVCAENGVKLSLLHYDRETGEYVRQDIF